MTGANLPQYLQLLWPTIVALRDLGGSGSIEEIVERVLQNGDYTNAQQAVRVTDGTQADLSGSRWLDLQGEQGSSSRSADHRAVEAGADEAHE
jgi:hypothetical protein